MRGLYEIEGYQFMKNILPNKWGNFVTDGDVLTERNIFRYPADKNVRNLWIKATGRTAWQPTNYTRVCSKHFETRCFRKTSCLTILTKGSVPTLYLPTSQENASSVSQSINFASGSLCAYPDMTRCSLLPVPRAGLDIGQSSEHQQREPSTSAEVPEWPDDAELNSDDDDEEVEQTLYEPPVPVAPSKKKPSIAGASGKQDDAAAGSSRLHAGYRCDQCRGDIVGFRYCCVECANYDLCGACEARGHHATHYVLRVPATKPHMEVLSVLENIRNVLLEKEEHENMCELEAEVKVEAPEPAPEPDPLAAPPGPSDDQEEEKFTIVEAAFPEIQRPSEKRDILGDMVVKLELDDEDEQTTGSLQPVPAEPVVYSHTEREGPKPSSNVKVYSGGGGGSGSGSVGGSGGGSGSGGASGSGGGGSGEGYAVYTHSAARPAPDPGAANKSIPTRLQGPFITLEEGKVTSSAKRKTSLPPQHAKVKKK